MIFAANSFGRQMVDGRYDPDQPSYTGWEKLFTYMKGVVGCAVAAIFFGVGDGFRITNKTIELFILMATACSLGIMYSYNKDAKKFKNW